MCQLPYEARWSEGARDLGMSHVTENCDTCYVGSFIMEPEELFEK